MTLLKKAALVVLIPLTFAVDVIAKLLGLDNPTRLDDHGDGGTDRVTSFEASAENTVEYRPTTDTLEDAAAATSEYNVYTERRVEIDPDRLEEWVRANYDDETRVKIQTKHGADVFARGEHVPTECPVCGEQPTLMKGFGDDREWVHMADDRRCTLEVADR